MAEIGTPLFTGAQGYAFNALKEDRLETAQLLTRTAVAETAQSNARTTFSDEQEKMARLKSREGYAREVIGPIQSQQWKSPELKQQALAEAERGYFGRNPRAVIDTADLSDRMAGFMDKDSSFETKQLHFANEKKKALQDGRQLDFAEENWEAETDLAIESRELQKEKNKQALDTLQNHVLEQTQDITGAVIDYFGEIPNDPKMRAASNHMMELIEGDGTRSPVEMKADLLKLSPILNTFKTLRYAVSEHGRRVIADTPEIEETFNVSLKENSRFRALYAEFRKKNNRPAGPAEKVKLLAQGLSAEIVNENLTSKIDRLAFNADGAIRSTALLGQMMDSFSDPAAWADPTQAKAALRDATYLAKEAESFQATKDAQLADEKAKLDLRKTEAYTKYLIQRNDLQLKDANPNVVYAIMTDLMKSGKAQFFEAEEDGQPNVLRYVDGRGFKGGIVGAHDIQRMLDAAAKSGGSGGARRRSSGSRPAQDDQEAIERDVEEAGGQFSGSADLSGYD